MAHINCAIWHSLSHLYFIIWHSMSHTDPAYISLQDATHLFDISKRTIERKISSGEINREQIRTDDGKREIFFAELVRVF